MKEIQTEYLGKIASLILDLPRDDFDRPIDLEGNEIPFFHQIQLILARRQRLAAAFN